MPACRAATLPGTAGRPIRRATALLAALAALSLVPACGDDAARRAGERLERDSRAATALRSQRFPTLLNVRPIRTGPRTYDFMVMVSSPYDSPRRFADGWRVLTLGGETIAEKRLRHPHPDEQPFWRRQSGVRVPPGVRTVRFEGHDSRNGYGGRRLTVSLP